MTSERYKGDAPAPTFYVAGPYDLRAMLATRAVDIAVASGWQCETRWLEGFPAPSTRADHALWDFQDLAMADAVVLFHGRSTAGGMWCELGMALAWGMPIIGVGLDQPVTVLRPRPPVFAALPGAALVSARTPLEAAQILGVLRDPILSVNAADGRPERGAILDADPYVMDVARIVRSAGYRNAIGEVMTRCEQRLAQIAGDAA